MVTSAKAPSSTVCPMRATTLIMILICRCLRRLLMSLRSSHDREAAPDRLRGDACHQDGPSQILRSSPGLSGVGRLVQALRWVETCSDGGSGAHRTLAVTLTVPGTRVC